MAVPRLGAVSTTTAEASENLTLHSQGDFKEPSCEPDVPSVLGCPTAPLSWPKPCAARHLGAQRQASAGLLDAAISTPVALRGCLAGGHGREARVGSPGGGRRAPAQVRLLAFVFCPQQMAGTVGADAGLLPRAGRRAQHLHVLWRHVSQTHTTHGAEPICLPRDPMGARTLSLFLVWASLSCSHASPRVAWGADPPVTFVTGETGQKYLDG